MSRARRSAIVVGVAGLLVGWAFLRQLTGGTGTGTRPYLETIGFAITTPAGLVLLTYLTSVFRFEQYYTERGGPGLIGDFLLAVLAAGATGLLGTAVAAGLTASPVVLFVVGAALTFVGAFGTFLVRTRAYFDFE